jgi:hypothetical protein
LSDHLSEWRKLSIQLPAPFFKNGLFTRFPGPDVLYTKSNVRFGTQKVLRASGTRLAPTEAERRPNVQWTFDRFKSCRIDFLMPENRCI